MKSSNLRLALALLPMLLLTLACKDDNDSLNCSFDNPPVIDTGAGQWPKFRRDLQNTGTTVLADAAYERVATGDPNAPADRELVWVYPAADDAPDAAFVGSPALNSRADIVYVGATSGRILGIHATGDDAGTLLQVETASEVRDFLSSAEPFPITTTPLVATRDGMDAIFVGGADARLFGVGEDGIALEDIWPGALNAAAGGSPTITEDGTVHVSTFGTGLFATCPNGVGRYLVASGSSLSSPAVGRMAGITDEDEDEFVIYGGDDGLLRAVREDGIVQWTFAMGSPILTAPIVLLEGAEEAQTIAAVFAVDANGTVVRVAVDGRRASGFVGATGIGRVLASPALADHPAGGTRLYVAGIDSGLHALDSATGARIWSWDSGTTIESSPAVVLDQSGAGDPIIVFGTGAGEILYIRDRGDAAEPIARFAPASGAAITSSPAVGPDGSVYFGGIDGRVYAVR